MSCNHLMPATRGASGRVAITGYLVEVSNPLSSGLATLKISSRNRTRRQRDPRATVLTGYIEAGFGVRQLVAYFGTWADMARTAPVTRLRFTFDAFGIVSSFGEAL